MKNILLSSFSLLVLQLGVAQDSLLYNESLKTIDSLEAKLVKSAADTNRVKMLLALVDAQALKREKAVFYGSQAVELAQKLDNKKFESASLRRLAIVLQRMEQQPQAITHLLQALRISEEIKDKNEIGENAKQIGVIYNYQKDYTKARQYLLQSKALLEEMGNDWSLSVTLGNLGRIHYEIGRQDSALWYYERSYQLGLKSKNMFFIPRSLRGLGDIFGKKGDYSSAMNYYRQSLSYNPTIIQSDICLSIAKIFQQTCQSDSALFYGKRSFNAINSYKPDKVAAGLFLSNIYDGKNDREAYRYLKLAHLLDDSLRLNEESLKIQNISFIEAQNKQTLKAARLETRNRIRLYTVLVCLLSFLVIALILFRSNRHKQKANALLNHQKEEIDQQRSKAEKALEYLKSTQAQLIQSEKMASLGELTAGIAHEIQNPLNFVNNFSEVNNELIDELKTELAIGNKQQAIELVDTIKENSEKINQHGKRADGIVKGMLQHSQKSIGVKELININSLAEEYLRLTYHSFQSKQEGFHCELKLDFDTQLPLVNIIPQDIGRVLLNLFNNAFWAVNERKVEVVKRKSGEVYAPTVSVSTKRVGDKFEIKVVDNGNGIPKKIVDKIFQPFFTTKPTGQGTGLGLSLSYDIIKAHGWEIKVESLESAGTTFIIQLPINPVS